MKSSKIIIPFLCTRLLPQTMTDKTSAATNNVVNQDIFHDMARITRIKNHYQNLLLCKNEEASPFPMSKEYEFTNFQILLKIIFGTITWLINIFSIIWYAFPELFDWELTDNKPTNNCCFQFYFFYLTHLTLCFQSFYYISSLFLHYINNSKNANNSVTVYCHKLMKISSIIGITIGFNICLVYWSVLNASTDLWHKNLLRICQHGISLVLLLIDDSLNNIWFSFKNILIIIITSNLYILMLIIHWISGWGRPKDTKHPVYVYKILN
eukprot:187214_1